MLLGLATVTLLFVVLWLASLPLRNASIVDTWWGPAILMIGLTYYFTSNGAAPRRVLIITLVAVWAIRLAAHVGRRNIGHGEDFRYAAWRKKYGGIWWIRSLFHVFLLQAVIAWVVAMPIYFAVTSDAPGTLTIWDLIGALIFVFGLAFETVGDEQLRRFTADAKNKGQVLRTGLWKYTRHPNYFGEAVLWWGLGVIGAVTPGGWMGLIGPALITFLLLRVSGVTMLEATLRKTKPAYADYIARTSAFWPRPPRRGRQT